MIPTNPNWRSAPPQSSGKQRLVSAASPLPGKHLVAVIAMSSLALVWGGSFAAMKFTLNATLSVGAVSYTHLDVYKRQAPDHP